MGAAESKASSSSSPPQEERPNDDPDFISLALAAARLLIEGGEFAYKITHPTVKQKLVEGNSSCFSSLESTPDLFEVDNSLIWRPPPEGFWMLNTDASYTQKDQGGVGLIGGAGGGGGIIRDHTGTPIKAFFCYFEPEDITVHELNAILVGLKMTEEIPNRCPVIVATDSEAAKYFVNLPKKFPTNKKVVSLVNEIKEMDNTLGGFILKKVKRESNKVADQLCKKGKQTGNHTVRYMNPAELQKTFQWIDNSG